MVIQLPSRDIRPPIADRDPEPAAAADRVRVEPQGSWLVRHWVLMVALAVVLFAGSVSVATLAGKSASDARTGDRPAYTSAEAPAGIGTAVMDGEIEFTVTAVDTGVSRVGTGSLGESAEGRFVTVHLTVKNTGTAERTLDPSAQTMIDQQGQMSSPDVTAGRAVEPNNFTAGVTPGSSTTGVVVFDLVGDAVPTQIQLHQSAFSSGVTVQLK